MGSDRLIYCTTHKDYHSRQYVLSLAYVQSVVFSCTSSKKGYCTVILPFENSSRFIGPLLPPWCRLHGISCYWATSRPKETSRVHEDFYKHFAPFNAFQSSNDANFGLDTSLLNCRFPREHRISPEPNCVSCQRLSGSNLNRHLRYSHSFLCPIYGCSQKLHSVAFIRRLLRSGLFSACCLHSSVSYEQILLYFETRTVSDPFPRCFVAKCCCRHRKSTSSHLNFTSCLLFARLSSRGRPLCKLVQIYSRAARNQPPYVLLATYGFRG